MRKSLLKAMQYYIDHGLIDFNKNAGQRTCEILDLEEEMIRAKKKWMKNARKQFAHGENENCVICGRYADVCEAHHIFPLWWQFENGFTDPNHSFIWLCPTHHTIVHRILDDVINNRESKIVKTLNADESALIGEIAILPFVYKG